MVEVLQRGDYHEAVLVIGISSVFGIDYGSRLPPAGQKNCGSLCHN